MQLSECSCAESEAGCELDARKSHVDVSEPVRSRDCFWVMLAVVSPFPGHGVGCVSIANNGPTCSTRGVTAGLSDFTRRY